ncbi:unnamed protein product [Adineta steineri]|uniref:Aspartate racemase n=2 Tax=Adineta steineri TaxID=433720 RepID=A0A818WRU6_9BILA|nr:unnamed protein product [Adineta steineri]
MDSKMKQQRICGLLGGLSFVSTLTYYNSINEIVSEAMVDHSSRIHMVSLDIFHQTIFLENGEWSRSIDYILEGIHELMKTNIDFLVICSNTAHIAVPRITQCYPNLVLLHISDAVAFAIKQKEIKKVGFLGTKMTMKMDSCVVDRLLQHGLEIVLPNEEDINQVHHIIAWELYVNTVTNESKQIYQEIIRRLYDEHHIEGVVLGCTEIPLLIKQHDIQYLPLFDSTQLHAQLAADYQLGRCDIQTFLPSNNH